MCGNELRKIVLNGLGVIGDVFPEIIASTAEREKKAKSRLANAKLKGASRKRDAPFIFGLSYIWSIMKKQ